MLVIQMLAEVGGGRCCGDRTILMARNLIGDLQANERLHLKGDGMYTRGWQLRLSSSLYTHVQTHTCTSAHIDTHRMGEKKIGAETNSWAEKNQKINADSHNLVTYGREGDVHCKK